MSKIFFLILILTANLCFSQEKDSTIVYKKRVLESTEVDFLLSYYNQDGDHSAVSGGIGSEELTDFASNIIISMPLNDDDVLTVDLGISSYTSASSSNINPFDQPTSGTAYATPWQASTGASESDQLYSAVLNYAHSSDSRNFIWNADVSFSNEYDYTSIGFGGGIVKQFNHKNTEVNIKANIYLDQWRPIYPYELNQFATYGSNFLYQGFFRGQTIYDENGQPTKDYLPSKFKTLDSVNRNSYALSFGFSQVINTKLQFSVFFDILQQQGLLSTPYHRIYFADNDHYYYGQPQYINEYTNPSNIGVYELADDIERLPDTRFKFPIGARINYYINEFFIFRTYYRYYTDNWGLKSNTVNFELPIKLSNKFTVFPSYRYYSQNAVDYYGPYQTHLSTEEYYTSDADLASFNSNQYGIGLTYTDIFTSANIWKFGLKNIDFRYNYYSRSDNLNANIATIAFKFIMQ